MGNQTHNTGISVFALLGIVFLILKLVGVIDWSWWLVLLPFYAGLGLFIAIILLYLTVKIVHNIFIKK